MAIKGRQKNKSTKKTGERVFVRTACTRCTNHLCDGGNDNGIDKLLRAIREKQSGSRESG